MHSTLRKYQEIGSNAYQSGSSRTQVTTDPDDFCLIQKSHWMRKVTARNTQTDYELVVGKHISITTIRNKLSSFTKSMKTVHISKYLTFLQGIKNEFVSNIFFVIGVLMILVIFGLHDACPRGCIAKWKLYSSRPLPRIQGFMVRLNKSCTWLDCEMTLTSCGISQRIKCHIIKI